MASKIPAFVLEQTHRARDTLAAKEIQHQMPMPAERRRLDTMWGLHQAAARVLEAWSALDSAAEFIDDTLMLKLRRAMAELDDAVRMSAA